MRHVMNHLRWLEVVVVCLVIICGGLAYVCFRISPVTVDNWQEAVKEEAAQDGCSLTLIAEKIGYARPRSVTGYQWQLCEQD